MKRVKETEFLRLEKTTNICDDCRRWNGDFTESDKLHIIYHSFFISETLLGEVSDKSISQTYEEINIQ